MKNKAFGLDIGTASMKAVWLAREKNGYSLQSVLRSPSPTKGILSESPLDQDTIAKAIRKMVDDANIKASYVNLSLPENMVYTKVIDMPSMSDKELASAIYWEAEQHIPVPLNTVTLDYTVLQRPAAGASTPMKILLVGAPTTLLQKYEKILQLANLEIAAIETESLATLRTLAVAEHFPPSLVVSIGTLNTTLSIIKNNSLVFTYTVPTGGMAITRAIATAFSFTVQQAEEYKKTYGITEENFEGKIASATTPILQSIITELKKAFAYYAENYKDDPIKQILISGSSAKLIGLPAFFTQQTNIETAVVNPWKILTNQEVPKEIIDNAPSYTIAVGLAMRMYE